MTSHTYADLLSTGAAKLRALGIEDPLRDARKLLLLVSHLSPADLIACENDSAPKPHIDAFQLVIEMRAARVPFAHIAGEASFYGLSLRSDSRALIPRADSEVVVELALDHLPKEAEVRVADLGTGSGALLAALLVQRAHAQGIAVEADENALSLAAENFQQVGVADRVQAVHGSWSDWPGWRDRDLIISNPPYIRSDVIPQLEPEVRDYDPTQALDGGADGLHAYREIIGLAAAQMKPGAHLVFEIGFDQKRAVSDLLIEAGFANLTHKQDLGGRDRAVAATKS